MYTAEEAQVWSNAFETAARMFSSDTVGKIIFGLSGGNQLTAQIRLGRIVLSELQPDGLAVRSRVYHNGQVLVEISGPWMHFEITDDKLLLTVYRANGLKSVYARQDGAPYQFVADQSDAPFGKETLCVE